MIESCITKIKNRTLVCGVLGLGFVGLPLAIEIAKTGFKTIGFDIQARKINLLKAGCSYISDVATEDVFKLITNHSFEVTQDFSRIAECDFISICVPTPIDNNQHPDTSYIENAVQTIAPYIKKNAIIVLESTTYPGTTEELVKPLLEKGSNLSCSKDFYLGFSPERVDPGNQVYTIKNTPKVVGAIGNEALDCIASVYEAILDSNVIRVSSPAVAEMEKILENTYRAINVGLINEMAILCTHMGINIWEVIDAASTKPFGFSSFYPGPGIGGHCIPVDPYYLTWKAQRYNADASLVEASMAVNNSMPEWVATRAEHILSKYNKTIAGARVLILGIAYKQNTNDCRNSPALQVIECLRAKKADVCYHDPWIPQYKHGDNTLKSISDLSTKTLNSIDIVIITTAHTNIDYDFIQQHSQVILDTRNAMKNVVNRNNIEVL